MNRIKRWTTSIVSSFDSVINKVENHESVVNSSIRELHEVAARAKVKLGRLKSEVASMKNKAVELETAKERWNERAIALRDSDKPKALECLRRRKRVEAELHRLNAEIPQHESLVSSIDHDVSKLETRIAELRRKKLAFSSRASRAKAVELTSGNDSVLSEEVDDIFERWEIKLTESEIGNSIHTDSLESEFLREEELSDLEHELDLLADLETKNK